MLSIEAYKKKLGRTAERLTEEQVLVEREKQDKIAEILFKLWVKKRKQEQKVV